MERLPIVVSGVGTEQLLGVPKLDNATGFNQSEVIFEVLNEWNIVDRVKAMCFDTPSVNTGKLFNYMNRKKEGSKIYQLATYFLL